MQPNHIIKVFFEDSKEPLDLNEDIVNMSELLKELSVFTNEPIKLALNLETFKRFLQFCRINNFKNDLKILKIRTNDLKQALVGDEKNYAFISEYKGRDDQNLVRLFKAAEYLRCESLIKLIAAVIACDIYFDDNTEAYEKIKEKLGVKEEITFREDEQYNRTYYFMEN